MHPGHMRHLEWARRQGDLLFVTLSEDCADWTCHVPIAVRLEHVAALSRVDYVAMVPSLDATLSVRLLEPDVLVRGLEFRTLRRQVAEREKAELSKYGDHLLFSSGLGGYPMGAGDALLAAGADIFEASILGNVAAAVEVMRLGNVPVTRLQLESKLTSLLESLLEMRV